MFPRPAKFLAYKFRPPPATLAGMDFSDLSYFYADFAVTVTHTPLVGSPASGAALFDQPGTTIIGGEILATDYSLRYPASTFQAVKRGDSFTIAGATYTARESAQPATVDGLEHIVPLARSA
ncbi:MAG: hypothetical protein Q8K57_13425 [Thiobacillus sp.]|nr:hypothetical protein [Thiobacillus sp.]